MRVIVTGGSRRVAGAVVAAFLILAAAGTLQAQLFRSFSTDPRNILEGNWQSCRESDGRYAERVYDHVVNGVGEFEVHMGPRHEFAMFKGVQDAHRDHNSDENLLHPYVVNLEAGRAKHRWEIPSLHLVFTATLAGGSRSDCESWYIVLEPLGKTSH